MCVIYIKDAQIETIKEPDTENPYGSLYKYR